MEKHLTVKDLKERLANLPDDMVVVYPDFSGYDGHGSMSFNSFKMEDLNSKLVNPEKPMLSVVEVKNQEEEPQEVLAIGVTSKAKDMSKFGYLDDKTFFQQFFSQGLSDFAHTK